MIPVVQSDKIHYRPLNAVVGEITVPLDFGAKPIGIPKDLKKGLPGMYALGVTVTVLAAGAFVAANLFTFAFAIGIGATCLYSHIRAKKEEEKWKKPENQAELEQHFKNRLIIPDQGFHPVNLNDIPPEKRAAYMGVGKGNDLGYKMMPTMGIAALVGLVATGIIL